MMKLKKTVRSYSYKFILNMQANQPYSKYNNYIEYTTCNKPTTAHTAQKTHKTHKYSLNKKTK